MGETIQGDAVALIDARLQQGERYFTLPEAAAMTGLSIDETRRAMEALLNKYVCRLQVSEHGDLIYHFGDALQRRGVKTAAERRRELLAWLWRVFTVIYKAWIAVTLIVYFIVFLVIVIAVLVAASSRQSSDDRHRQGGGVPIHLGSIFDLFFSIFRWHTVTGTIDYQRDAQGYRYRHYEPRPAVINAKKKNFMSAVYDFVFGPPRVELDPLGNEKEVAAYLQQNNGIVVTAELSALAGWTLPQAETFLTDCILRYRGESKISEDPVLYGQFDELMRGVGEVETGEVTYYWDEYEPEYELNGNGATQNMIICVMNGFNLLIAFLIATGDLTAWVAPSSEMSAWLVANAAWVRVVLGWIPLVFSILFFGIPLLRGFQIRQPQRRRQAQNVRKRLFKAIFARRGQPQTVADVATAVNRDAEEAALASSVVEAELKQLALDMPGDMDVSETAEVQVAFPRLTAELEAVSRLRRHRRDDDALGTIVIESDNC